MTESVAFSGAVSICHTYHLFPISVFSALAKVIAPLPEKRVISALGRFIGIRTADPSDVHIWHLCDLCSLWATSGFAAAPIFGILQHFQAIALAWALGSLSSASRRGCRGRRATFLLSSHVRIFSIVLAAFSIFIDITR